MKKILLLLLVSPFLLATQCEDDENSGFETSYIIQNDTNADLYFLWDEDRFTKIDRQSSESIASDLNSDTSPIPPEETFVFESVLLFERVDGNFILIYKQDPIDNDQWDFEEPEINRFKYTLVLSEDQRN